MSEQDSVKDCPPEQLREQNRYLLDGWKRATREALEAQAEVEKLRAYMVDPLKASELVAQACKEAMADEREACARVADHVAALTADRGDEVLVAHGAALDIARLIRARGKP